MKITKRHKLILEQYAANLGYTLVSSNDDSIDFEEREIYTNLRQNMDKQVYSLLHELGHAHIIKRPKLRTRLYKLYAAERHYAHPEHLTKVTPQYRYQKIYEEIMAWEIGRDIAEKLSIPIDSVKYDKLAGACVSSYMLSVHNMY